MSTIFICLNDSLFPDSWSVVNLPGSIPFDENDLPENYAVEFAEKKWQVKSGKLVPASLADITTQQTSTPEIQIEEVIE